MWKSETNTKIKSQFDSNWAPFDLTTGKIALQVHWPSGQYTKGHTEVSKRMRHGALISLTHSKSSREILDVTSPLLIGTIFALRPVPSQDGA